MEPAGSERRCDMRSTGLVCGGGLSLEGLPLQLPPLAAPTNARHSSSHTSAAVPVAPRESLFAADCSKASWRSCLMTQIRGENIKAGRMSKKHRTGENLFTSALGRGRDSDQGTVVVDIFRKAVLRVDAECGRQRDAPGRRHDHHRRVQT